MRIKETAPILPAREDGAVKDLLHRARVTVVAVCLVLVTAACTSTSVGEPQGIPAVSATASSVPRSTNGSGSASVRPPSARPRQLQLAGVDPCGLLTAEQRDTFGIDREPQPGNDPTYESLACHFSSHAMRTGFGVYPVTAFGIERFQPGLVMAQVRSLTVAEFSGVELYTPMPEDLDEFCVVAVDVADGQAVVVDYGEEGHRPHLPRGVVCTRAAQVAGFVVSNLMARR